MKALRQDARNDESLGLLDLLLALRRRIAVIALAVVATAALAAVLTVRQPPTFAAEASVLFRPSPLDTALPRGDVPFQDPARTGQTNVDLVSLGSISLATSERLRGRLTADQVSKQVSFTGGRDSDLVTITAQARDPALAATLANVYAREVVAFRAEAADGQIRDVEQRVEEELRSLPESDRRSAEQERRARQLRTALADLRTRGGLQTGDAQIADFASPGRANQTGPRTGRNVLLGAFGGLLLGLVLALGLEQLDRRVRSSTEVEELAGLPMLGSVPQSKALAGPLTPSLPPFESETFRILDANLRHVSPGGAPASILLTSASPGEGKTTVAFHLALASAQAGSDVLLIETDLRHTSLSAALALPAQGGLGALLTEPSIDFDDACVDVCSIVGMNGDSPLGRLKLIPAGHPCPQPVQMLGSKRMEGVLREAESRFDLVILDTAPVSVVADAIPLLTLVEGVVVVTRLGEVRREALEALRERLERMRVPVLGVVITAAGRELESAYSRYAHQASGGGIQG